MLCVGGEFRTDDSDAVPAATVLFSGFQRPSAKSILRERSSGKPENPLVVDSNEVRLLLTS